MSRRRSKKSIPKPFRSWYEYYVAQNLDALGIRYEYEQYQFSYYPTISKGICLDCNSKNVSREAIYTPDWYFPDHDFFIETKGILSATERKKLQAVQTQCDIDLKVMIDSNGRIRGSKKWERYSDWLEWAGFEYSIGKDIPERWFK